MAAMGPAKASVKHQVEISRRKTMLATRKRLARQVRKINEHQQSCCLMITRSNLHDFSSLIGRSLRQIITRTWLASKSGNRSSVIRLGRLRIGQIIQSKLGKRDESSSVKARTSLCKAKGTLNDHSSLTKIETDPWGTEE